MNIFLSSIHHHLALALLHERVEVVGVGWVADLSHLSMNDFWIYLDHRSWAHCYDAKGERQPLQAISKLFAGMQDDPYRSLAASV
jgi:hypothetical protein